MAHFESIADFAVTSPMPVSTSVGVLTAANRDKIFFTQHWAVEPLEPGVYNVASSRQAVGGTGRFTGAAGVGAYRGRVDLNTGTAVAEITGSLIR